MHSLSLDGHYIYKLAPWLSWSDLLYGLEQNYVDEKEISDYICCSLTITHPKEAYEIAVTPIENQHLIHQLLSTLASQSKEKTTNTTEPWLFLSLSFLFDNKHLYNNIYEELEILYSDFNYPEELAPLIRYMPPSDGTEGSKDYLLKNWKAALSQYEQLFAERRNPQ
jgi:hypothetical protein